MDICREDDFYDTFSISVIDILWYQFYLLLSGSLLYTFMDIGYTSMYLQNLLS